MAQIFHPHQHSESADEQQREQQRRLRLRYGIVALIAVLGLIVASALGGG